MPNTYTPSDAPLNTVTEPVDGENRNVASVTLMTRTLADGIRHIQNQTEILANLNVLAAITTPANGILRFVDAFGWYVFRTTATTGLSPFRVAATDATTGGWVSATAHETSKNVWVPAEHVRYIATESPFSAPAKIVPSISAFMLPIAQADLLIYGVDGTGNGVGFLAASTDATKAYGLLLPIDPFMIPGATLATVTLRYKPGVAHGTAPDHFPAMAVIRRDEASTGPQALLSTGSGILVDSGGTFISERSLVYTTDQNNVVDPTYGYTVQIWSEHGTNASTDTGFHGVILGFTNIPDARR